MGGFAPHAPQDLSLFSSRVDDFVLAVTGDCRTMEGLDRRIGQRRDATRAPIQARSGWRPSGRLLDNPSHHLRTAEILSKQPRPPHPKQFIGMELEIGGSELTPRQTADIFSRVMGKPVKYGRLPMLAARILLGKDFHAMFRWLNREGFQANIHELRRKYPEIHLHSLEEWLREDGWDERRLRFRAPKE
jgi:hypothetical protein